MLLINWIHIGLGIGLRTIEDNTKANMNTVN